MALGSDESRELLSDYLDIIIENLDNVTKADTSITASGVSQDCTEYTAVVDYDTLVKCAKALLTKAQTDKELKEFIYDYLKSIEENYEKITVKYGLSPDYFGFDADDTLENIYDKIDEWKDDFPDFDEEDYTYNCSLSLYVDNSGNIIGIKAVYANVWYGQNYSGFEAKLYTTKNKTEFGVDLDVESYDYGDKDEIVRFKGNGTIKGNKRTGDMSLSINDTKVANLSVEDVEFSKLINGSLNGKVTITPKEAILYEIGDEFKGVSLVAELGGTIENVKLDISAVKNSKTLATLNIEYSHGKKSTISIPTNAIDIDETDEETLDFEKINDTLSKAGMPEELIEEIKWALK